ncbi:galactose oxidase-like domain-containing protein [Methylobacterium sp. JK268]
MTDRTAVPAAPRDRADRRFLLGTTILATALSALPAAAAQFKVVVNQAQDPILSNLAIPDSAPQTGMWSVTQPWPVNAILAAMMPNGKIATWGTPVNAPGTQDGRTFDIWDPTRGFGNDSHTQLNGHVGANTFCGTGALQSDGSLLTSGGIFDPDTNSDKSSAVVNPTATGVSGTNFKLANDRYYSTMISLATYEKLILGGVYPYADGWKDPQGTINNGQITGMTPEIYNWYNGWHSVFGANSRDAFGPDNNRYWYPRAWQAPNGKIFGISSDKMWYMDYSGNGAITAMPFREAQRNASSATDAPNVGPNSTAVMYDNGKILQVGGNSLDNGNGFTASSRATVVDLNGANPTLADTAAMNFGRSWANATVLPTGTVLVNGGSKGADDAGDKAVLAAELWNAASGRWTLGASEQIYRGYHSTATLLQNGTVMISGGGAPGPVANQNTEIYYPPYLFASVNGKVGLAPRPQIVSLASTGITHGQSLQFEVSSTNAIAQVVLLGLTSVTHSFNSGQRRYVASFSQSGTVVTMQGPASGATVPPGYYQLAVVDQKGVPSPGVIVSVGSGITAPGQVAAPMVMTAQNGGVGSGVVGGGSGAIPGMPGPTNSWSQIGQWVNRIAMASDGTLLSVNMWDQTTWKYVSDGNNWSKFPYLGLDVAATNAGGIYLIGIDNKIWRWNAGSQTYAQVGAYGQHMSAGADGTVAVVNTWNDVWLKRADDTSDAWVQIPGKAKRIAVMNRNSLWAVGTDDNVYRIDGNGQWTRVGTGVSEIAASSDGAVVTISLYDGSVWRKIGDNTADAWTKVPTNRKAIAVAAPNAQRVIMVGDDHAIYRW